MKKISKMEAVIVIAIVIIIISPIVMYSTTPKYKNAVPDSIRKTERVYECDYRTLNVNTKIVFTENGKEYSVEGDIFRFLTDPLKLYDSEGNVIGTADDTYNLINQDDHTIIINDRFEVAVHGNFEVIGNSYELYDESGNKVGHAEFNGLCTAGGVYDKDMNCIAVYTGSQFFNDYKVSIYDNSICSDKAILMLVASYVSDYHADD